MQLSENTITVLKNFSNINQSLIFPEGSVLKTLSPKRNILAVANIKEEIPKRFAIYELNQFLGVISLFSDPDLDIKEQHVKISNGSGHVSNYFFAEESMIDSPPEKDLSIDDPAISFELKDSQLKAVLQAARVMQLDTVVVESNGSNVSLKAVNTENATSNTYQTEIAKSDAVFRYIFSVDNLRLLPLTYNVVIAKGGISNFASSDGMVQYWIATEHESNYNG